MVDAPRMPRRKRPVPRTFDERCAAFSARATPDQFFSHVTAARLLGLPLPTRVVREPQLHVSVVAPLKAPEARGIVGHTVDRPIRLVTIGEHRLASPVDAWAQLAGSLTEPDLIVMGDALVRKKRPFATMAELEGAVADLDRRRGVRTLRAASARIRPGTASPPETELRLLIIAAGLPEPLVGYEVHDDGYFVGTPDLAYPAHKVAIEYEGEVHRVDLRTFREDIDRRERFEDAGWRVIRVTADHLRKPHALIERIRYALGSRAATDRG